jgi:hypothetical protein
VGVKQKLPPNYILDLNGLNDAAPDAGKKETKKAPATSAVRPRPLCTEEGCVILGYTATTGDGRWQQDFELRGNGLYFATQQQSDTISMTIIEVLDRSRRNATKLAAPLPSKAASAPSRGENTELLN